jgi:transposase
MKPISKEVRAAVILLHEAGNTFSKIAALKGISKASVSRIVKEDSKGTNQVKRGRPRLLSDQQERYYHRQVLSGKIDTAVDATKCLLEDADVQVSADTFRRSFKRAGMTSFKKKKKPLLTRKMKKRRLEWARSKAAWTTEDWARVIFSDETKVNRWSSDGVKYSWKMPGATTEDRLIDPTIKHGGGSLMMWGCFSFNGIGFATKVEGTLNADFYQEILGDELLKTIDWYELSTDDFIFQQDNAPCHTARTTMRWFEENNVQLLDWPSNSPDLNPIENLWAYLKTKLKGYPTKPKSIKQLWERMECEWEAIPQDYCKKLVDSMPDRICKVIKAKGAWIKY